MIMASIITMVSVFPGTVFAQSKNVTTTAKITTSTTVATSTTSATESPLEEKIAPVLEPVKIFFINLYTTIDNWRVRQGDIWKSLKSEKEEQIAERSQAMDDQILERSEKVLREEQNTVVQGAGDDFDGSIFLLKLYVFVLGVFVIIFTYAWLFYLIFGFIVFNILRTLYIKLVDVRRTW